MNQSWSNDGWLYPASYHSPLPTPSPIHLDTCSFENWQLNKTCIRVLQISPLEPISKSFIILGCFFLEQRNLCTRILSKLYMNDALLGCGNSKQDELLVAVKSGNLSSQRCTLLIRKTTVVGAFCINYIDDCNLVVVFPEQMVPSVVYKGINVWWTGFQLVV